MNTRIINQIHKNLVIKIFLEEIKCHNSRGEKIIRAGVAIPTNSLSAHAYHIGEADLVDNAIVNRKKMIFGEVMAPGWGSFNLLHGEKFLRGHRYQTKFFSGSTTQKTLEEAIEYCLKEINKI